MTQLLSMSEEDLKRFIDDRLSSHPDYKVLAISVLRYPTEYSVTVWVGQTPTPEMRRLAYELEVELANLGVTCNIVVKSDQERSFGDVHILQTGKGSVSYRYLRADPIKDEDVVLLFSVFHGSKTYRVRVSMSGTLGSMLRMRNKLDETSVREIYLDEIRKRIEQDKLKPEDEIMFDSRHREKFALS